MDGRDEVLEVVVLDDDPVVAELVLRRVTREPVSRAAMSSSSCSSFSARTKSPDESGLNTTPAAVPRLQPELDVERDPRGGEREEPLALRLLELLPAEEDVGEDPRGLDGAAHLAGDLRERAASRFSSGGCVRKSSRTTSARSSG